MCKSRRMEKYFGISSLAEVLSSDARPIVLYGTGNGADKIVSLLAAYGRSPDAVFASDGFVRDRTYCGLPVESFDAVRARYGRDMLIVVCFGSDRADVMERIDALDREFDVVLPDVPLYGDGIFDRAYVEVHADELFEVRSMLSDDESKALFDDSVMYRLTGKIKYLRRTQKIDETYGALFARSNIKTAADCGAYRGETAEMMLSVLPECERVYALEPDEGSFKKLAENADDRIVPICAAASDVCGEGEFSSSSSRGAGINGRNRRAKTKTITSATLDSIINEKVDLIKLDVEGDEEASLRGAGRIMAEYAPCLAVSLYHRTDDLRRLPRLIRDTSSEYRSMKYYLRRPPCYPCWDLMLYAVKEI